MKKIVIAVLVIIAAYQLGLFNSTSKINIDENVDVVLLATAWCKYCEKTRKLLNKHDVPYVEYDIEKSSQGRDYYERVGKGGIPILIINGEILRGYAPKTTLKMLSN